MFLFALLVAIPHVTTDTQEGLEDYVKDPVQSISVPMYAFLIHRDSSISNLTIPFLTDVFLNPGSSIFPKLEFALPLFRAKNNKLEK